MKRTLAWFAGLVGIAALGRVLARRRRPPQGGSAGAPVAGPPTGAGAATGAEGDPAAELRRKLAAQRDPEEGATAEAAPESIDERRARVHAKAREAIEAMDEGPSA